MRYYSFRQSKLFSLEFDRRHNIAKKCSMILYSKLCALTTLPECASQNIGRRRRAYSKYFWETRQKTIAYIYRHVNEIN